MAKQKEAEHKKRMSSRKGRIEREKHNNQVYALMKFSVMLISYCVTYFSCNDYSGMCMSFFVMALTIMSDMLIILLTTDKNARQYQVSFFTAVLSTILMLYFLFSCVHFITFSSGINILSVGYDIKIPTSWRNLKFIYMGIMFVLIGAYSLEYTGILKMPKQN